MQTNQTAQQFSSWIQSAAPDDLVQIGKQVLSKIGTLPQEHRDRFYSEVRNDPTTAKLFTEVNA